MDTIDLFSEDWSALPVENPLAPSVALADLVALPVPDQKPPRIIQNGAYTMDAHMLAFVAQARYYGHRHAALEPISKDVGRRRIFDIGAVGDFARELIGEPGLEMTPGNWRRATLRARETGRRP